MVSYRHFGISCRPHLQRLRSPRSCNSTATGRQASEMLTFEPQCSVYMVTGYGPEDRSSVSNRDWNFILSCLNRLCGPPKPAVKWALGFLLWWIKLSDSGVDHPPPHEVLMLRIYAVCLVSPYILMAWCLWKGTSWPLQRLYYLGHLTGQLLADVGMGGANI
jgi:hypothetical protein